MGSILRKAALAACLALYTALAASFPIYSVNDSAVWRDAKAYSVNDGGTWRHAITVSVNDAGTWRPVFTGYYTDVTVANCGGVSWGFDTGKYSTCGSTSPSIGLNFPGNNPVGYVMARYANDTGNFRLGVCTPGNHANSMQVAVQTSAGGYHFITTTPTVSDGSVDAQCAANGTILGLDGDEVLWSAQPTIWNAAGTRRIYFFFPSVQ